MKTQIKTHDRLSRGDTREQIDNKAPKSVFETRTDPGARDMNAYGEESNVERDPNKSIAFHREKKPTANDEALSLAAGVAVALPPFMRAYKGTQQTSYVFTPPGSARPSSWPTSISLGKASGNDIGGIVGKAWELYGQMLHALHAEQLKLRQPHHSATLEDGVAKYKQSNRYKKANEAKREEQDRLLNKILHWSSENAHPPMASITQPHAYAFMMTHAPTHNDQREIKAMLSEVYKTGMQHGYTDKNIAAGLRMPANDYTAARYRMAQQYATHRFTMAPHLSL